MTADEHLKLIAGDLLVQIALWKAQVDTLQARLAALEAQLAMVTPADTSHTDSSTPP